MRLVPGVAAAALVVAGATAVAAPASASGSNVTITSDSADINVAQDPGSGVEVTQVRKDSNFVSFAASRNPPESSGPEGAADTFVSQSSTVQTPSSQQLPTGPVSSISTSGRLTSTASRSASSSGGTPVADSAGSFVADFTVSRPTPVQFDGILRAANNDSDQCTDITVKLTGTGSQNYSFAAAAGSNGTCGAANASKSFVVTDVLPADTYELNVQYDGEVSAESAGTVAAGGAVDVHLLFFEACTQVGTPGADTILGTPGDDVLCGRGGDDTISGAGGNDLIFGEGGNDTISGGPGNDIIRADAGNDTVHGGGGADRILGGSGNDRLLGDDGADALIGGLGRDDLEGGTGNDTLRARDGRADWVRGGTGSGDVAYVDSHDSVAGVETVHR